MKKIVKLVKLIRTFFPSRLPQGVNEFEALIDRLFELYPLPTLDRPSIENTVSALIINGDPGVSARSDRWFVNMLRGAAAKQVAGEVFYKTQMARKAKAQAEAAEAERKAREPKEVTSSEEAPSSEHQI